MGCDLGSELRDRLGAGGACLVGYADLSPVPAEVRQGLPRAVSIATALRPEIAARLVAGPSREYLAEYQRLNALLTDLGKNAAEWLRERGYQAAALATVVQREQYDITSLSVPLPHKTAATRSGLGWIGKCALLVTEQFGSAIRLTTVLTDAPLPVGTPVEESRCGACTACREACPAGAVSGKLWHAGLTRQDFYDAHACRRLCQEQAKLLGISESICGRCLAACPRTQAYLKRQGGV